MPMIACDDYNTFVNTIGMEKNVDAPVKN